jgi:hypothetical protein
MAIAQEGSSSRRVFAESSAVAAPEQREAAAEHETEALAPAVPRQVFEHPDNAIAHASQPTTDIAAAAPQVGFDYPATQRGATAHFVVYYDPSLGADGITIADGVLATCEQDYDRLSAYFGGLAPSTMNVIIAAGIGGAYHYGCDGKDLYCDAQTSPLDVDHTRMLLVAEVVEVFSAEQGIGWDCGASNGEGLSRVLATEPYPAELNGFNSASTWLDTPGRPDFVDQTDPTDRNYISIGCSVLFLNWLRYELKYGWAQIVAAGAPTLAQTYTNLTGNIDGWVRFSTQLAARYPVGTPSGLSTDNPYPLDRHSGYLVQGLFGGHGNFEVVTPRQSGGLAHYWRDNDDPALPWNGSYPFGGPGEYDSVTLIESNFGNPGNLEVVARTGDQLHFYWRDSGPAFGWNGPYPLASGAAGNPALIQSRFGARGNFEMVVPLQDGGLAHYWRNNDDPALPWNGPYPFGQSVGDVDEVALAESNYGDPGNLELVVRAGESLLFFWRDSGPAFTWNGPYPITAGVQGRPALLQSRFGSRGNFELVTPLVGGGLAHLWRNNDDPAMPWNGPYPFGAGTGYYSAVTMIQSNFGDPGNLEVVAQTGNLLAFFWRDSGPSFTWNGPYVFESGV